MKILVTGATGFIGQHLCHALADGGHEVVALYRSEDKKPGQHPDGIMYFRATLDDIDALRQAMTGCTVVYHLAAYASVYAHDKRTYKRINYEATLALLELCVEKGVQRVLVCSTAGVFGPSEKESAVNENSVRSIDYFSDYERYKDLADKKIMQHFSRKLHIVIVCPSRVYGPGRLSESNAVTKLILGYSRGRFRFLPGNGQAIGNYVFVKDVVAGMIDALKQGKSGQRYLLGGENLSYREFFRSVAEVTGKPYKMVCIPTWLIIAFSAVSLCISSILRTQPLLTPQWARKYLYHWGVSSRKAQDAFGYHITPLKDGIRETLRTMLPNFDQTN